MEAQLTSVNGHTQAGREPDQILCITADCHEVVRQGMTAIICGQKDMAVVGEARDGREAVEQFKRLHPNVFITCLRMPKADGVEAIKTIRRDSPDAHILVFTSRCRANDLARAMEAGANGVLLKDATMGEITDAIRAVNSGRVVLSPDMRHMLSQDSSHSRISFREREVLSAMAHGMNNQEIAEHLGISRATVKTHVERVYAKLNVSDRTKAVVQGIKRGLVTIE